MAQPPFLHCSLLVSTTGEAKVWRTPAKSIASTTPSPLTPEPSEKPKARTWAAGNAVRHSSSVPWFALPEPPLWLGAPSLTNCRAGLFSHQSPA